MTGFSRGIAALQLVASAAAPAPRYELETGQVLVTYQVPFGRHQLSGFSTEVHWNVTVAPDGSADMHLRVPVESFASGHPLVDQAMREALGGGAVEIQGTARAGASPLAFRGTVTIRGVARPLAAAITTERLGHHVAVRTAFALDADDFGIVRPPDVGRTVEVTFAARLAVVPGLAGALRF